MRQRRACELGVLFLLTGLSCGDGRNPSIGSSFVLVLPASLGIGGTAASDAIDDVLPDAVTNDIPIQDIPPGAFGSPCSDNANCDSGICVEGFGGYVCTRMCEDDCPAGWSCKSVVFGESLASICIPVASSLCAFCTDSNQCGSGICLSVGGQMRCGLDCEEDSCPPSFTCHDGQCIPNSGTCDCMILTAGTQRPCLQTNEQGTCYGMETCDPDQGFVNCTASVPATETCNGYDDDCDLVIDDSPLLPETPCTKQVPGVGECAGQWTCGGEAGWQCVGAEPGPELCNYLDDDCDGATDEDFKNAAGLYDRLLHCGQCNRSCDGVIPFAQVVACDATRDPASCVVEECAPGYYEASDTACRFQWSNLCNPCETNANCGVEGDLCLSLDQTPNLKYCGRDCSEGSLWGTNCPTGYACRDVQGARQCLPESDTCECTPSNAGMTRVCGRENAFGVCYGTEVCESATGWIDCSARTPAGEVCNGLDDDCNGYADDQLTPPTALGPCEHRYTDIETFVCTGHWLCRDTEAGKAWFCDAAFPVPETCNYQDDNCNGRMDETFPMLGKVCYAGIGACQGIGMFVCTSDGSAAVCNAVPGTSSPEVCDNLDNDCDAVTDEGFEDRGKVCFVGVGECLKVGTLQCTSNQAGLECSESPGTPVTERCDAKDNDCDGSTDETWPMKGSVCSEGIGECQRMGTLVCNPGQTGLVCNATPGPVATERCDGLDNDCDRSVDETWGDKGKVCFAGQGECRRAGTMVCTASGDGIVCDAVPGSVATERCDGLDNDCDNSIDETWGDKGKGCFAGQGECRRAGTMVCKASLDGIVCDAVPGNASPERCDGLDNDCMGDTDEDWPKKGEVCYAGLGICTRAGIWVCDALQTGIVCNAIAGLVEVESCNYLDDDCDGTIDNGFFTDGKYRRDTACGNCFTNCTQIYNPAQHHANGHCDASGEPVCTFACVGLFVDADHNPENGCELEQDGAAVYVSTPSNGGQDAVGCGVWDRPCATIQYGIDLAGVAAGKTRVLVSEGIYPESVRLRSGISLKGGYNGATWQYDPDTNVTVIQGSSPIVDSHKRTVIIDGVRAPTEFSGFTIYGENNHLTPAPGAPGGNSYALWVRDCDANLVISGNLVYAGRGSTGAPGGNGGAGSNGGAGGTGQAASSLGTATCSGSRTGGVAGTSTCGATGGAGGPAACPGATPTTWTHQAAASSGLGTSPGTGGAGGWDRHSGLWSFDDDCSTVHTNSTSAFGSPGSDGGFGTAGGGGQGCASPAGGLIGSEWSGATGTAGALGTHGSGGGGGGGGGGINTAAFGNRNCNLSGGDTFGSGGGGGGGGGCGGGAGTAGSPGGGSFALFMVRTDPAVTSAPTLAANTFIRNHGGAGGSGGNGGSGGFGGRPGAGGDISGLNYTFAIGMGGYGGQGGSGGHGGGGGGGCGGASYGIFAALSGLAPDYCTTSTFGTVGNGGAGGSGGNSSGNPGSAGSAGSSMDCTLL